MTKHASGFCCVALGSVLCLVGACEDEAVKVPDRVWDAAMAVCERWKGCDGDRFADLYTRVEECADVETKYFPWDEYTEECIEAHIASLECEAAAPCIGGEGCGFPAQLRSYHCWRFDSPEWGVVCGDPSSADWQEECDWQCGSDYEPALCSDQTPDYCQCGDEQCAQGEHCCTCLDLW